VGAATESKKSLRNLYEALDLRHRPVQLCASSKAVADQRRNRTCDGSHREVRSGVSKVLLRTGVLPRRWRVTSQELDALVFLAGYGVLLVAAIKVFGLRPVLAVLFGIVFLAVVVAFKTLGAVTGGRRY
jgi:hypothetical protein